MIILKKPCTRAPITWVLSPGYWQVYNVIGGDNCRFRVKSAGMMNTMVGRVIVPLSRL